MDKPNCHPVYTSLTLILLQTMPRSRDVVVPKAVRGIEEVVITHTKTKRGTVRTKEKVVPVVLPKPDGSGQSSKLRKQVPLQKVSGPGIDDHSTDNVQTDQWPNEQGYDDLGPAVEDSPPQATVCANAN